MTLTQTIAILIGLSAAFAYINFRFLRLPMKIGLMIIALAFSLGLIWLGRLGWHLEEEAKGFMEHINFNETLLHGLLSFLLFAGALEVDLDELLACKGFVATVATIGVLLSTVLIGVLGFAVFRAIHVPLSLLDCLLFGALISPTDPIAVAALLKESALPRSIRVKLAGESLLNDGVGVVAFVVLLEAASRGRSVAWMAPLLFLQEALGGALLGWGLGYAAYRLLKTVDHYDVEILITLALAMGGYALAEALHTSGAIATVVAGLWIGNHGRRFAMSEITRERLDSFWELLDEMLNAVLFVLIGLEILTLRPTFAALVAGMLAIPIVLTARWLSVGIPIQIFNRFQPAAKGATPLMTWAGLRGGISVALALSLPAGVSRHYLVSITYIVVVFSIVVQGLTMGRLLRRYRGSLAEG